MLISVVTPFFNEEESIVAFAEELRFVLEKMDADYEVLFVDDGSTDGTVAILSEITWPQKKILRLQANVGHQAALETGYRAAAGDFVITLDSDLQHPPEVIPRMLEVAIADKVEVVYATRKSRSEEKAFKRTSAVIYYRILGWLSGVQLQPSAADFRLISKRVVRILAGLPAGGKVYRLLIPKLGLPFSIVPYVAKPRFAGQPKYDLRAMVNLFLNSVVTSSIRPLFIATQLSILFAFLAVFNLGYVLYAFLAGFTVPGWASVSSALLALFSVNFLILGIFGAYLARLVTGQTSDNLERVIIEGVIKDD